MESKHLTWLLKNIKPKTAEYEIRSKHDLSILGIVKWYPSWRQYCFFPELNCVWSKDCLYDLQALIFEFNIEHKKRKRENDAL